jgi:hypothetical protein
LGRDAAGPWCLKEHAKDHRPLFASTGETEAKEEGLKQIGCLVAVDEGLVHAYPEFLCRKIEVRRAGDG